jgi:Flp pilus assembly protein TadG
MRRLTSWLLRRVSPSRLGEERGAVAVFVALMIPPLLGFAAIAIDVASLHSDRAQLRNAADAAALAVAVDCARNVCGNPVSTATTVVGANTTSASAADASVRTPSVSVAGSTVTVTASADQAHWFAPVLGLDSTRVTARAGATWLPTTSGRANFPLIISYCEYEGQVGKHGLKKDSAPLRINATTQLGANDCKGPSGTTMKGYAVTAPDSSGICRTTSAIGGTVNQFTDMFYSRLPSSCTNAYLASLIGTTVLVPVWDKVTGTYPNTQYRVWGYSAFYIAGYDVWAYDPALIGYFTWGAQLSDATTLPTSSSAPDLGARSVFLTNQG